MNKKLRTIGICTLSAFLIILIAIKVIDFKYGSSTCLQDEISPDGSFLVEEWQMNSVIRFTDNCNYTSGYYRLRDTNGTYLQEVQAKTRSLNNLSWTPNSVSFTYDDEFENKQTANWPLTINTSIDIQNRQENINNGLMDAIDQRNITQVISFLDHGANPNFVSEHDWTPLSRITALRLTDDNTRLIAQLLIDRGANIHRRNKYGDTLLSIRDIMPGENSGVPIISSFVEKGLDVNAKNNVGETPLHLPRKIDEIMFLVQHGAHVNAQDNKGNTPLDIYKARNDVREIENYLRSQGAIIITTK